MIALRNPRLVLPAAALALAASVLFCAWTVSTTGYRLEFLGPKRDYYNLLAQGFRRGHLYMDAAPDPALLALPPGERPGNAPFLLDASLYRDHYYLYFGVVPVVLLYLPYAALTGQGLPEAAAALFFASAGLVFAALWWFDARRRLFPALGGAWTFVSILGIAVGSAVPSTLRRPIFYEVAITAGYAFMMLALWSITRARYAPARRTAWLVLGQWPRVSRSDPAQTSRRRASCLLPAERSPREPAAGAALRPRLPREAWHSAPLSRPLGPTMPPASETRWNSATPIR